MSTVAGAATHDLGATGDARKWLVLAGVVAGVLLATIDGSIVNVALPTMRDALPPPSTRSSGSSSAAS